MAYDPDLAARIKALLIGEAGFSERKMFGGICFMLHGHMACGVIGDDLIARVGPERYSDALAELHTRLFDFTGRPMTGWVVVTPPALEGDDDLRRWVEQGVDFARSLPSK